MLKKQFTKRGSLKSFSFSNEIKLNCQKNLKSIEENCHVTVYNSLDDLLLNPLLASQKENEPFKNRVKSGKAYWAFDENTKTNHFLTFEKDLNEETQAAELSSRIISALHQASVKSAAIKVADLESEKETQRLLARYLPLHNFVWDLKTKKEEDYVNVDEITFVLSENHSEQEEIIKLESTLSYYKNIARSFVNTRADVATPDFFIEKAQEFVNSSSQKDKITLEILRGPELLEKGLNLLHAVGRGSDAPPALIVMKYKGNEENAPSLGLVGKGVTFDTGGYNLKPTGYMETMYDDKAGACAVFAAFQALVETKTNQNVCCAMALAENKVDSTAYRPSDIIKSYKGLTVEIGNTDAEGRLCLADAISYLQKNNESVKSIIELSTLTGAIMVGLGLEKAGLFTQKKGLESGLMNSSEESGEQLWPMPVTKIHIEGMKGKVSDLKNDSPVRWAGSSYAAGFLEHFIEEGVDFAHLDIAGVAMAEGKGGQLKGATGFGVGLLHHYTQNNFNK